MKALFEHRSVIVLMWCFFAVVINSVLFAVPMGYPGHPVVPVRSIGLTVNLFGSVVGWIAFVLGTRKSVFQKITVIVLISIINFFLVCNLWNVLFLGG